MTGLEWMIAEMAGTAETPLYSMYRWMSERLGHMVSLAEFLRVVGSGVRRDVFRLWQVETSGSDRTELFDVPRDLESRYMGEARLDPRYDPFGLSLTLGAAAGVGANPDWEVDLDFVEGTFRLEVRDGEEAEVVAQLERCLPGVRFAATGRSGYGDVRRVVGKLVEDSSDR
jgi:hypothetical protein